MRKRDENNFKKTLRDALMGHLDLQSIEDKYSKGIPDLNYCAEGTEGWIELKIMVGWPAMENTPITSALRHLTPEQCNWMRRRTRHGGRTFLFIKIMTTREFMLFKGEDAREVKDATEERARELALQTWTGSVKVPELLALLKY